MIFQGEHLLIGFLGKASIYLSIIFVSGAAVTYLLHYFKSENNRLLRFSRLLYYAHLVLLLIAGFILYYIIYNHYFEYNYVWKHSSVDTPLKYIISCFWAGQEGSFLTWLILQGITGIFVIRFLKAFEPLSMALISFVQFFLLLNILGISLGGLQIGASPFFLLREVSTDPLFNNPQYLSFILDGNGLNPLLQNPWMVTHPPIIFLGYALSLIPYALAMAALADLKHNESLKPLIKWVLISLLFLGTGIIIGGAWAYEALTFGGFWAWDPVENASLVPWIILLAALHFLLISVKTKTLFLPSLIFSLLGYIFVVYASFLTRSGILANTSAHSFGKDDFQYQIVILLVILIILPIILILKNLKHFNKPLESKLLSVEFFKYLGSIFLLLSAFQIILSTSLPVINHIFSTNLALPVDSETFYNKWQLPFAVIFCLFISVSEIINYKITFKQLLIPLVLTITIVAILIFKQLHITLGYILLYLTSVFCILMSLYIFLSKRKKMPNIAAVITHLGFGIFIFGVLLTFSNKTFVKDDRHINLKEMNTQADPSIMLYRGETLKAGLDYYFYESAEKKGNAFYFNIFVYNKMNDDTLKFSYKLNPYIVLNENMGNVYEPDIKKFWNKDIFSYISYADLSSLSSDSKYQLKETLSLKLHDTVHFTNTFVLLDSIYMTGNPNADIKEKLTISARIKIGDKIVMYPEYIIENNKVKYKDAINKESGLKIRFKDVSETENTIIAEIYEENEDFIVLKVIHFPFINLMWFGVVIIIAGFTLSIIRKIKKKRLVS